MKLPLEASRPDNDSHEGPDVLWRHPPSASGCALEAKTDKKATSQYQKRDDIGQFHDHVQYLRNHHPNENFFKAIVGLRLPVSQASHPPDDLRIVELEQFQKLAKRVEQMYHSIASSTDAAASGVKAERWLHHLGLLWPMCFDALGYTLAKDLMNPRGGPEDIL